MEEAERSDNVERVNNFRSRISNTMRFIFMKESEEALPAKEEPNKNRLRNRFTM
jgi:hypothetical protein